MDDATHFLWRTWRSGNPNKSWIVDGEGNKKLSPLMTTKSAQDLCAIHNQTVNFLLAHIPTTQQPKDTE